jgi:hypothetical protein
MNKSEIEELKSYRDESKRGLLFLKKAEHFSKIIADHKKHFGGFMSEEDVDSNAALALSDTYDEIEERMFTFALMRIDSNRMFGKHLQRVCRQHKIDCEPLSKILGKGFRKENMGRCWDGYTSNFCSTDEEELVDSTFMESFSSKTDYSNIIAKLTEGEETTDVYFDLKSRFIDHMSFKEVSEETRNIGRSSDFISKRLYRYVEKLQKRANLLKIEGL